MNIQSGVHLFPPSGPKEAVRRLSGLGIMVRFSASSCQLTMSWAAIVFYDRKTKRELQANLFCMAVGRQIRS